nr:hypothetical protein Itr_chr04CG05580 [Ipomoea trifida]GMC78833.1 hypothetical protein Iba_chr04aCG5300 [Ipomoea batatas]GMC88198.1 hypothetical protein Iba_chr04eCG7790 [Ipomoea batatas]
MGSKAKVLFTQGPQAAAGMDLAIFSSNSQY